jgi:hypothetical protein
VKLLTDGVIVRGGTIFGPSPIEKAWSRIAALMALNKVTTSTLMKPTTNPKTPRCQKCGAALGTCKHRPDPK